MDSKGYLKHIAYDSVIFGFSGEKLSPTLWRAVAAVYGKNTVKICKLSKEQLEDLKKSFVQERGRLRKEIFDQLFVFIVLYTHVICVF